MKRTGNAALILIVLAVAGTGYYLSQNPATLDQVENSLDFELPENPGGGVCSEAQQWAEDSGYSPQGCACSVSGSNEDLGDWAYVVVELDNNRVIAAMKANGEWGQAGAQPGQASDEESQNACDEMEQIRDAQ